MKVAEPLPRLPKTGIAAIGRTGSDKTYQAGQNYPATRWTVPGDGTAYDAHTGLTWCQAPQLVATGGTGILVTGCVRGDWKAGLAPNGWTPSATPSDPTVLDMGSVGVAGLVEGYPYKLWISTVENPSLDFGPAVITNITGVLVTLDLDTSAYKSDTFADGLLISRYLAGELVKYTTNGLYYVARTTHDAGADPTYDETNWAFQPFILSAVAPFTITPITFTFLLALDAVAAVNAVGWNGKTDWRVPNMYELGSIYDHSRTYLQKFWQAAGFVYPNSAGIWSGTPLADDPTKYLVYTPANGAGYPRVESTAGSYYAAMCRGGIVV